jgi:integrase
MSIGNEYSCIDSLYTVDCFPIYTQIHKGQSQSNRSTEGSFPMNEITLIEPSIADAMKAIETAETLPAPRRMHWLCSLRQIAKALNKPPETIPARWSAIKNAVHGLHPAQVATNPKTLANHKSNARAALLWFAGEKGLPKRGVPLSAGWASLRGQISELHLRERLSGLMHYCSAKGMKPELVDESVLDGYMRYRADTTALAANAAARRAIARAWNACTRHLEGWPRHCLVEPPVKALTELAWESFPEGLRAEIERYLSGLSKIRKGANGKRIKPCKVVSIDSRRRELQAFTRMAVRQGLPAEGLTSLSELLNPDLVDKVLTAYWEANGEEPSVYTINLAWKLFSVAREMKCLSESDLQRLDDLRAALEEHRHGGLTEKNLMVIRHVLSEGVWDAVVQLPISLMKRARTLQDQAPVKAAVTAQLAVAIAILTFAPVRLRNLIEIKLGENLIKPGGLAAPYWLVFPHYDVKNRVQLEFPLDATLSTLIDEYIHDFRPSLLRASNESWLFPGQTKALKTSRTLSLQITARIQKALGLRITVHQFRHAAAAILLKHRPGEYELVRRLLGQRNIQTTMNFYVGLENIQASEIFGQIVKERLSKDLELSE